MYSFIFLLYFVTITNCQLFGGLPSVPGTNKISQVASKVTSPFQQALDASYNTFQTQYKKVYDNPQIAQLRKSIFEENFKKIEEFNEDFKKGLKTFELGVNEFIDLTLEEFNKLLNGFGITRTGKKETQPTGVVAQPFRDNIPDQVDWREKGAVGPVKHQGQCASCYAFSAAGVLEGQVFRKTGKFYDLSPQHIMDCSSKAPFDNDGCKGGYTDLSIDYMEKNNGINIDNVYPYEGKENQCRTRSNSVIGHVTGCYRIREGDEKALEAAVANIGPISAAIDAGHSTFQNYKGGIYDEPDCGNQIDQLNHSILIVGYGVDKKTGQKYWICKNSYGPGWGENGYFRLAKDKNNHCGIASWAVYPKVEN